MQLSDFDYHLPESSIAQFPADPRDSSKLLILQRDKATLEDAVFRDIADMLSENDVLVVNETKVINARLKGKITGIEKDCEIFLHKQMGENTWDCLVYPGKKLKPETEVIFHDENMQPLSFSKGENSSVDSKKRESGLLTAKIIEISEKGRIVEFSQSGQEFLDTIEKIGKTPLPPYIKEKNKDAARYQTVYHDSAKSGSVAAPTAGLHFTPELLEGLETKGVQIEKVCLHVGLGTFAGVEVDNISEHQMHSERAYISEEVAKRLNAAKEQGKRIIATGTTSVRTLESFARDDGQLGHGHIDTEIFIYPGYTWKFVDSIITNFHLPKSTLIMLVSSFAGYDFTMQAYQHAVENDYRFFSYGDAMWIQ